MTYDDFYINGYPAMSVWGAVLGDGSLSALMAPPPLKDYITNECAAMHGRKVANAADAMPKVDSRDVQLTIYIYARSKADFYAKYQSFVAELQKGKIKITTAYQPGVVYRLYYISCAQFSHFNGNIAKLTVKFNEPNPMDRDAED